MMKKTKMKTKLLSSLHASPFSISSFFSTRHTIRLLEVWDCFDMELTVQCFLCCEQMGESLEAAIAITMTWLLASLAARCAMCWL